MKKAILVLLSALATIPPLSRAEEIRQMLLSSSPSFEAAAAPLRNAPAQQYEFSQAVLADVLRLLAHDAGVSFFSLPANAEGADTLVTFNITASPFRSLETLSSAYGVALIYDNGIWYMRPANDRELIGRTYYIKYNALEVVTASGANSGGGSGGGSNYSTGSSGISTGISLQGNPQTFEVEPSTLIDDIRELLDLQTTGFSATIAPSITVDSLGQPIGAAPAVMERSLSGDSGDDGGNGAKVIWNSDANSLYVVATRQQHMWVEGYLASADQPQSLIALEVKFFETSKDPSEQFGMDWTGTLGDGYSANVTDLDSDLNLDRLGDYTAPQTAVLSYDDLELTLRALYNDTQTSAVSYPRMLTLNNREVVLRSVINQPVLASTSSTSVGAGATETSSVSYLPIGTVLNVLPKRMADQQIQLNISLIVSSIVGEEIIEGNPFPVASSRVYAAPVIVDSGYTVAIGGLDEAVETQQDIGIPILGRIPIIGTAFAYQDTRKSHKNLLMFITPTIVNSHEGGIKDTPEAVLRITPHSEPKPKIYSDGTLVRGMDDLPIALASVDRETEILEQIIAEGRSDEETQEKIAELYEACELTIVKIRSTKQASPESYQTLDPYETGYSRMAQRLGNINTKKKKRDYKTKRTFPFNL